MADARALAYRRRLDALFSLYAETFTLIRAGESSSHLGLFTPMDNGTASTFFDANETVGLLKPSLSLYLSSGDDPTLVLVNDTFFRGERLWTVRKTVIYTVGNTPLVLLALCD